MTERTEVTGWTPEQERTITAIMATETMHDPHNATGDRRIKCSRIEAIRRLQRRTKSGVYQHPTEIVLANAALPVSPIIVLSPEHRTALAVGRAAARTKAA